MDPTLTKPKLTPATSPKTTAFIQELAICQVGERIDGALVITQRAATERAKPRAGGRLPFRLRRSPQAATPLRCSVFEPAA